ncbi:hypothetical protein Tco_1013493 [Tanacetum coccineum]
MSFSKRAKNAPICYTKPLDSLKNWKDRFLWVDASIFPLAIPWNNNKTLRKDPHPTPAEFNADVCNFLADKPALFRKFPEPFLCFVISQMGLFTFIHHADPTKVKIGEWEVREGEVLLLELTRGRVVSLAGVNDQGGADVQGAADDNVNQGVVMPQKQIRLTLVTDQSKKVRKKMKAADGASGSGLPPKKLKEDHDASGDVGASIVGKSLVAIQELFEQSTLNVEIGVMAAATVPFVTSFVTPTPEHEDSRHADSVIGPNMRTKPATERFFVLSDSSHHSSTNVAGDEVTSIVRSLVPEPPIMTTAVATTVVADTFARVPRIGPRLVPRSIFGDSASTGEANPDTTSPSHPVGTKVSSDTFFIVRDMDAETLQQMYVPKWTVINDYALDDHDVCQSVVDHLAPLLLFYHLYSMDYEQLLTEFNVGTARQTCLSSEVRLRLEHKLAGRKKFKGKSEAAKVIRLRGQIANVEAAKAAKVNELNDLKERNAALEGQVAALECAAASKDAELASSNSQVAKMTQDLSNLQLSCDELSVKASFLEFEKDKLVDQVSALETTCSDLRNEVMGYKLFKEQIEAV